jgi:hypothetical protein
MAGGEHLEEFTQLFFSSVLFNTASSAAYKNFTVPEDA